MHILIKELKEGQQVISDYYLEDFSVKKTSKGQDYLNIVFADRSGSIAGKMWDNFQEAVTTLKRADFATVHGEITVFNGNPQIKIVKLEKLDPDKVIQEDYLKKTSKNVEQMYAFISKQISEMKDQDLRALMEAFFIKDTKLAEEFKNAPAAKSMHNAFIGGLMEHIVELLKLSNHVCSQYTGINKDLLTAGVFLHDIGKLRELESGISINYTDEGKLIGHHVIGVLLLNEKIKTLPNFPDRYKIHLEHMIISHHGLPEWGSSKRPATLEAVILHHIDNIDSKITGFQQFLEVNPPDDNWTKRAYMFDSELYTG